MLNVAIFTRRELTRTPRQPGPGLSPARLAPRRDRERAVLVAAVLVVRVVEGLQEGFLLVRVVLVGLRLGQVLHGVVGHRRLLGSAGRDARHPLHGRPRMCAAFPSAARDMLLNSDGFIARGRFLAS